MNKHLLFLVTILIVNCAFAVEISSKIEKQYLALGGPKKALEHLKCILRYQEGRQLALKRLSPSNPMSERCNQYPEVRLQNLNYGVIVNYTVLSNHRQLFLVPTEANPKASVTNYFVSHGKYGNTDPANTIPAPYANTVLNAKYLSNVINSNASASGFYITGEQYYGEWQGPDPQHPLHSLYLHGMEPGVNDNSCERATVFHGNQGLHESGPEIGMNRMSSGCFMLAYEVTDSVIARIRGPDAAGGAAMLVYSPREARLDEDYYCR